jgi:hypothetical protein
LPIVCSPDCAARQPDPASGKRAASIGYAASSDVAGRVTEVGCRLSLASAGGYAQAQQPEPSEHERVSIGFWYRVHSRVGKVLRDSILIDTHTERVKGNVRDGHVGVVIEQAKRLNALAALRDIANCPVIGLSNVSVPELVPGFETKGPEFASSLLPTANQPSVPDRFASAARMSAV